MDTSEADVTILVPLDGSGLSEQPLPLAAEIARRAGARLLLLSVPEVYGLEPAWYGGATLEAGAPVLPIDEFVEQSRREAQDYLEERSAEWRRAGFRVDIALAGETPAEAITAAAEAQNAALVVMATHGRRGLSRWAFGSVADKVLHSSGRPVLVVRSGCPTPSTVRRILVALDGSELAEAVLPAVTFLARALRSCVALVHVTVEPERLERPEVVLEAERRHAERMSDYLEARAAALRDEGIEAIAESASGEDIAATFLAHQAETGADLVALTTHGRAGVRRWAFGCIADRVLSHASVPVLLQRVG